MLKTSLNDARGKKGENILAVCLLDYSLTSYPLFYPEFLGDKFPGVDYLVLLERVPNRQPYFFAQVKTTANDFIPSTEKCPERLEITTHKEDIENLLEIPSPTYILGIHEPSKRVFARSVFTGTPVQAITRISVQNELTPSTLKNLYDEVRGYWETTNYKPTSSVFS